MKGFKLLPVTFLVMVACQGFPTFWRPTTGEAINSHDDAGVAQRQAHVQLELQEIHYDGETLTGRLLVGVVEGRLRLNKQLLSGIHADARDPVDCNTGWRVNYMIVDSFQARRKEDLLVLDQGYWFGKVIHFPLFDEHFTGLGPECLKVEIWLFSFDGTVVARQEIRAERNLPLPVDAGQPGEPPDAGQPEEPPDAGTRE